MIKTFTVACLMATALTAVPALAQNNNNGNSGNNAATTQANQGSAVSAQDFVKQAAISGLFEIQSSRVALNKSQDQDIKQFAQHMINDHTKIDDQLKSVAKNEQVPTSLDQQHQQMVDQLKSANGSNFAEQFKTMQVQGHQQAIQLFQNYAQNGNNDALKQFAQRNLPILRQHLQMAQSIDIASNGNGNSNTNTAAATAGAGAGAGAMAANGSTDANAGGNSVNAGYISTEPSNMWRASKIIGLNVYNDQQQKVGDINEVLFNRQGQVQAVVIGVGGFLGIGEHNVAVPYNSLSWDMRPVSNTGARNGVSVQNNMVGQNNGGQANMAGTTTAQNTSTQNPAGDSANAPANTPALGNPVTEPTGASPTPGVTANQVGNDQNASNQNQNPAYPDHAVLANATRDQLKNAPEFHYGNAPR